MANKRVIDMQELSELGDGWYTFLDSATGGTKKFDMGNMLNAIADAQDAAEAAQSAATSAREAADGVVSPTVTPSQITGGTRVTITDVDGTRTFDVMDGPQGEKGDTGDPAAPGSITTDMLADGAVTGQKLADGSVTLGKLAEDVNDRISTYWAWFQDGENRRLGIVTDEQE